jgi:dsRNA-specific ribonuclease
MAAKDPIMVLGERSQRRGTGNYREAYSETEDRFGEQQWRIVIKDNESGKVGISCICNNKKKARKDAAVRLLKLLGEDRGDAWVFAAGGAIPVEEAEAGGAIPVEEAECAAKTTAIAEADDSLNNNALAGDKVLGLCLVLWLRGRGVTDKGEVTRRVANLLSNEALQRNAHKIGVEVSGHQTHRDGSLVEQRVWLLFCEHKMNILKTLEAVRPLFEKAGAR